MKKNRNLKKLNRILCQVKSYKNQMAELSDNELAGMTEKFKERLAMGETLDDILPEAYAVICEADYRVLKKFPYDVQILGAIALHQGKLIEMNTGEGKTLVGTMPLYLNALTGKSNILMTSNEYLAIRDCEEMGPVYRFMGLTVSVGVSVSAEEQFDNDEKREIYNSDIVYTTHSVFGFDYLLNNLVNSAEDRFMRDLYYVIIDEADLVLLDSAQTPLVISGAPRVQSNLYDLADFFVTTLIEGRDYVVDDKKVWLTEKGIEYAENFFKIDNFYGAEHFEINRHVILALRAHKIFEIEKEYMISKDRELQLIDGMSGRAMSGVKLRGGQHQALEVKEKLKLSQENRSIASITFQNLFLLFPKMSGMSGTILDAAEELKDVYGRDVVVIPPKRPLNRKDLDDFYYENIDKQFNEAIDAAVEVHKTGQPVLIVVSTIAETEIVSKFLIEEKIPHSVLNANNAFWEADIIKEAGQMNAVTIATSMAGRGTDIRLGEGVREMGGLAVIGIGRMPNVRQERQARGRAGRQGDPGFSRFYVSIQDEVVNRYKVTDTDKYISGEKKINKSKLRKIIDTAQKTSEEFAVISRRQAMDYDRVLQKQRELIYGMRNRLLDKGEVDKESIMKIATDNIQHFLDREDNITVQKISRYILDNISYKLDKDINYVVSMNKKGILQYLTRIVTKGLEEIEEKLGKEKAADFIRIAILQSIDDAWIEQVDYLQQLQVAVTGRTHAQRNPVYEYQNDALEAYKKMEKIVIKNIVRNILLSNIYVDADNNLRILLP